jgi:cob(I)alamin adenosyltransferase
MKFSKKGDQGKTSLLGGQRVPKFDPRPQTYGVLDEASSVLGVARAMTANRTIKDILLSVQKDLLIMGAELSLPVEEKENLSRRINEADVKRIEGIINELQKSVKLKNEFVYPGETVISAQIDVGRTVIRRAERKAAKLKDDGLVDNPEIHKYLNRVADMLFTLSRYEEAKG